MIVKNVYEFNDFKKVCNLLVLNCLYWVCVVGYLIFGILGIFYFFIFMIVKKWKL